MADTERIATRESIKSYDDVQVEKVHVPEWGNQVFFVRSLGGTERDKWEAALIEEKTTRNRHGQKRRSKEIQVVGAKAKLVILSCCLSFTDHSPIFTDADYEWLSVKAAAATERIFLVAQRLSGISQDDMDDIEGN